MSITSWLNSSQGVAVVVGIEEKAVGEGADADLASYLLFDGDFARALVDLGRRDAEARRDELIEFLYRS